MKPKKFHFYLVAWLDKPPTVQLCSHSGREQMDDAFIPLTGGHEPDGRDQLIKDLGPLKIPSVPDRLKSVRCKP